MKILGVRGAGVVLGVVAAGCMSSEWRATPAERPLSRAELGSPEVTVTASEQELANAVARAMASEGFHVVSHAPYHTQLELALNVVPASEGPVAVATLRSDGFFVAETRAGGDVDGAAATVAKTLASSQAMADFVRNNGVPQQNDIVGR